MYSSKFLFILLIFVTKSKILVNFLYSYFFEGHNRKEKNMSYAPLINSSIPSPEYYQNYMSVDNSKKDTTLDSSVAGFDTPQKKHKTKNMLIGSLIALASLASVPFMVDSSSKDSQFYNTTPETEMTINDDVNYEETPTAMINFDSTKGLTPSQKESIDILVASRLNGIDPENKVLLNKQVKSTQLMIDKLAAKYKDKTITEDDKIRMEMQIRYITDKELLDRVNFTEISKYQHDLTVLKALIAGSRERIPRNSSDAQEEFDKQVENAQKLVNDITTKYKKRAKVAGNTDGDTSISLKELLQMLNLSSLDGLSEEEQMNILRGALSNYKTQYFSADNDEDIKRSNEQITNVVQDAQNKIDSQADAHKRFNLIR